MTTIKQGNKIFIGGIANDIIENHSRGFGFITVEDSTKVDLILRTQPHIIKGKKVECKLAIPREIIQTQVEKVNEDPPRKKSSTDYAFYLRKLFVGGLPLYVNENDMMNYFQRFGEVERCIIKREEDTGRSRGFGFVIFEEKDSIDVILSYGQNHFILGKWIECKRAQPKDLSNSNLSAEPFYPIGMTIPSNSQNIYVNNNNGFIQPYMNQTQTNNTTQNHFNENRSMYLPFNKIPNDFLNSMAATPNKWSQSFYSKNSNLFQIMPSRKKGAEDIKKNEEKSMLMNLNKKEENKEEVQSKLLKNSTSDQSSNDRLMPYLSNDNLSQSIRENSFDFMEHNPNIHSKIQRSNMVMEQIYQLNKNSNNKGNSNFPLKQTRDIDSFTNYFNNCLQNPYWNSYFHYKLFDTSGEDVSKLAYKNSNKIKLFLDEKGQEEDPTNNKSHQQQEKNIPSMTEFNSSRTESWKNSRNFKLKKDKSNNENSTGLYKPY